MVWCTGHRALQHLALPDVRTGVTHLSMHFAVKPRCQVDKIKKKSTQSDLTGGFVMLAKQRWVHNTQLIMSRATVILHKMS